MSAPRLISGPRLIAGLAEIAAGHDALICDVWGVIHDGQKHHPAAADALFRFRENHGPVILLTNAPRVPDEVAAQCRSYGLPDGCYDAIVSSGGAARDELARRSATAELPLYYIGPDRDLPMIQGLDVRRTGIGEAAVALCIGLVDDMAETPADYDDTLKAMRARGLTMLCANPDLVVHRGSVGDGLLTDIRGADRAGLDALFIADGVHGEDIHPYTPEHLAALLARYETRAGAAMRALKW